MKLNEKDFMWAEGVKTKFEQKMKAVSKRSRDKIPSMSIGGVHDDKSNEIEGFGWGDGIDWWTNGFWAGIQWMLYQSTGEQLYKEVANHTEDALDLCIERFYGLHHDVGFMWLHTSVANYRMTGNEKSRKRALRMANLLAGRFNPAGNYIRAWNGEFGDTDDNRGWAIIDCMMNINLLYWATKETKDPRFANIAMCHADTAAKNFIREDGSVRHICEFDPYTGAFVRDYAGQGYAIGSSWTRGQGWAIYGFVLSFLHTGKKEYLDVARKVADYFIASTPESGIIPVDFRQPKEPAWEDSSAAAIAACGMIEIAKALGEEEGSKYLDAAIKMLRVLDETRCDYSLEDDCIVQNCSGAYHREEHHYTLIYGDQFYMEAIYKLLGAEMILW